MFQYIINFSPQNFSGYCFAAGQSNWKADWGHVTKKPQERYRASSFASLEEDARRSTSGLAPPLANPVRSHEDPPVFV